MSFVFASGFVLLSLFDAMSIEASRSSPMQVRPEIAQAESETPRRDFEINPDREDGAAGESASEDETEARRKPPPDVIDPDQQAPGCRMRDGLPLELIV
jgi:hypothetical protein